jgi:hypothetical protein
VLVVGCGCRGRSLGSALLASGLAVRGTSRRPESLEAIAAAGIEPAPADPDRLGTLMPQLDGVGVVCWLLAGAGGPAASELNGPRLQTLLERLVDTPVRGFVLEAPPGGSAPEALAGAERRHIPLRVIRAQPEPHERWLSAAVAAVESLLA